jgi:hypothetical protein
MLVFLFPFYPFRKASDSEDLPSANPRTRFSKRIKGKKENKHLVSGSGEFLILSLKRVFKPGMPKVF